MIKVSHYTTTATLLLGLRHNPVVEDTCYQHNVSGNNKPTGGSDEMEPVIQDILVTVRMISSQSSGKPSVYVTIWTFYLITHE